MYELEEQKELATNRLTELEKLSKDHQEALTEIEKLKTDVSYMYRISLYWDKEQFLHKLESYIKLKVLSKWLYHFFGQDWASYILFVASTPARTYNRGQHRVQMPAVPVLCAVQWQHADPDTAGWHPELTPDQQKHTSQASGAAWSNCFNTNLHMDCFVIVNKLYDVANV